MKVSWKHGKVASISRLQTVFHIDPLAEQGHEFLNIKLSVFCEDILQQAIQELSSVLYRLIRICDELSSGEGRKSCHLTPGEKKRERNGGPCSTNQRFH